MSASNPLALLGGKPRIDHSEWPSWPPRGAAINAALAKVADEDEWGVHSAAVSNFETAFARHHDAEFGLAMASGTVALYCALSAAGVGPGDEVIVPGYTFMATAAAVLQCGALPVLADIDPLTFNFAPAAAAAAVTTNARAIMPVHIGGNPADMEAFKQLGIQHDIAIIEDAAQAPGAIYGGKKVGAQGKAGCFSFQSSKNMTAGEGGILLTNDDALHRAAFEFYNCGRTTTGPWSAHVSPGLNLRLSAFQAAILQVQLQQLEADADKREGNGRFLEEQLNAIDGLQCAGRYALTQRNAYHLLIFTYDAQAFSGLPKAKFLEALMAEGVVATDGYRPLQSLPFIEHEGGLPATDRLCRDQVWLRQFELLAERPLLERAVQAIRDIQEQAHLLV